MSKPDANGWMPIDTAPKDGTRVWLRLSTGAGPLEYIGSKDTKPNSGWHIEPNGYWVSVTHWRPPPSPSDVSMNLSQQTLCKSLRSE